MPYQRRSVVLLTAALLAAGSASGSETTTGAEVRVERVSDTRLRVLWNEAFAPGTVRIYAGPSPGEIDRSRPVAEATGGSVTLRSAPGVRQLGLEKRLYFELVGEPGGSAILASERRLPLEGADNFRDLGGYRTVDGRRVRWGVLYRSSDLSDLTSSDLEYLSRLGVRVVCDLRTVRERSREPDRIGPDDAAILGFPVEQKGVDPTDMRNQILTGGITRLGMEHTMRKAYRAFVAEHSETWAALLRRLARAEEPPGVVHCTAGKDRTGFAAALVLLTLGVPQETVFEDYLLTNTYRADFVRTVTRWAPLVSFFRTRPEDVLPLLEARPEYLQASLDAMVETYGSVDAYLAEGLGVDAKLRAALAARLLD